MKDGKELIDLFSYDEKNKNTIKKRKGFSAAIIFLILVFAAGFAASEAYGDILSDKLSDTPFYGIIEMLRKNKNENEDKDFQNHGEMNEEDKKLYDPENIYDFDYSLVKEGEKAIVPLDLSLSDYGSGYIYNDTSYELDILNIIKGELYLPRCDSGGEPLVLIIHTHTTEAFCEENIFSYKNGYGFARSEDSSKNVVALGKTVSDILNGNGIPTLHCEMFHDSGSYMGSYMRSAETIKKYLAEYPSIKYVFDIHRDSIVKSNGELVRPVTAIDGKAVAQIMCVVGTDENISSDFDWERNLSLAVKIREDLNRKYANLARGTCLRPSAYNQQYAEVAMLFEIGSDGNTLEEAQNAAEILAYELVGLIKNNDMITIE